MAEALPPADWTAIAVRAAGSRHYQGAGLGSPLGFTCPSCGKANAGALEAGCEQCGAGKDSAKHVGVDPPAKPRPSNIQPVEQQTAVNAAFTYWLKGSNDVLSPETVLLCLSAFKSGIAFAEKNILHHIPTEEAKPDLPLKGSRESRTIVAALRFFRENVLAQAPEEVRDGEWLSAGEVDSLIEKLEA